MITSDEEVRELADRARAHQRIGIDTEFLWERTYSPLICLVQLNVAGELAIVDPLEDIDISPIADLVSDPAVEVVMHAPHADLVAFVQRLGSTPTNIFDTQVAAGFAGMSAGLSYERLAQESIGAKVQPSESFSDWSRRPLSEKQLRYAAEDVEHLFDMADEIRRRLEKFGRTEWAEEELARRFADMSRIVTPPEEQWRRVAR
ncbi:MAG: ribonuclease D, partial [Thermoleophilia bacterium]|nr:ribonuclease D [Thermoleophilia bacterium]